MSVTIQRAVNGYVVIDDANEWTVIEEDPFLPNPEADAALKMLWEVNEQIGHVGSRYDAQRVSIKLVPGDKHEGVADLVG